MLRESVAQSACLVDVLRMCSSMFGVLLFCSNFQKLSPNLKKRLAVENDDKATQWSVTDLLPLHERIGKPLLTEVPLCCIGWTAVQHKSCVMAFCRATCPTQVSSPVIGTYPHAPHDRRPCRAWGKGERGAKGHGHSTAGKQEREGGGVM